MQTIFTAKRLHNRAVGRVLAHPRNQTSANPFFYPERVVQEYPPVVQPFQGRLSRHGSVSEGARVRDPRLLLCNRFAVKTA